MFIAISMCIYIYAYTCFLVFADMPEHILQSLQIHHLGWNPEGLRKYSTCILGYGVQRWWREWRYDWLKIGVWPIQVYSIYMCLYRDVVGRWKHHEHWTLNLDNMFWTHSACMCRMADCLLIDLECVIPHLPGEGC